MSEPAPHYLIASFGSFGDIYPFLSLALALQRMGRAVTFVSPQKYEDTVRRAGVPFVGVRTTQDAEQVVQAPPDLLHSASKFGASFRDYARELQGYVDAALAVLPTDAPCVIAAHPFVLPMADLVRARRPGVRVVGVYLSPAALRTCHDPLLMGPVPSPRWVPLAVRRAVWRGIDRLVIDPVPVPATNRLRATYGLPPIRHLFDHAQHTADLTLTLFPDWFGASQPDFPKPLISGSFPLYTPVSENVLPDDLQRFLQQGDPPVVVLAGTDNTHATRLFGAAVQAMQASGRRAVFLTSYAQQVPSALPPSIHWSPYAPLQALLPHVSAMVHHGGIGTMAEGLRAAVPQLITPFAWDQFDNAARARALGVARTLHAVWISERGLLRALDALLGTPSIRERCTAVADRLALLQDHVALCRAIEQALANG
jgi:rhamnosyltransferase subunit B